MKIKNILSVGCSNTVGVNLEEEIDVFDYHRPHYDGLLGKQVKLYRYENNFSTRLANMYAADVTNLGVSGASNERIIFSTVEQLQKPQSIPPIDLVLVNLSGQARMTFEHQEKLFDIDLSYETDHLMEYADIGVEGWRDFVDFYRNNLFGSYTTNEKQHNLYTYIVNFLENKKIPYIITQTVPTEFQIENYTDKCIPITFDEFNEKANRKRAKGNHWLSDSHEAWAIELHKVIEKHYAD